MPSRPSLLLLTTISLPAFTFLYLHRFHLSQIRSHLISQTSTVPASLSASSTIRKIVNPRHHVAMEDTRIVQLSKNEIKDMSDEEILARFVRGFFGGWAFWPEKCLLGVFTGLGLRFGVFGAGFDGVPDDGKMITAFPLGLTKNRLPEKHAQLFGGNFLVLDSALQTNQVDVETVGTPEDVLSENRSYIDIGFGDNRKTFAGVHRFEVLRGKKDEGKEDGGARIAYSCLACNPTVSGASYSSIFHGVHKAYALMLFRDGITGVLET